MGIQGIDGVVYGVEDIGSCRKFFLDWGLEPVGETSAAVDFETLNGCEIRLRDKNDAALAPAFESGSTLREVTWGVESSTDLDRLCTSLAGEPDFQSDKDSVSCLDPNGMSVRFRVSRRRQVDVHGVPANVYGAPAQRIDRPSPVYDRAEPVKIGHVVFFTPDVAAVEKFYVDKLGFVVSDRYVGRAVFMRCAAYGGHHDIFFLQLPTGKRGLNHVAFSVRDIHEVFGGGLNITRCGWETDIGPGKHPISSAFFWYVRCPAGGNAEYYTDEDQLTPAWKPRDVETKPENFAEWAIVGGVDAKTRRQKTGPVSEAAATAGQATRK